MPTSDPFRRREWTAALFLGMILLTVLWPFEAAFRAALFLTAIALVGWSYTLWKVIGPKGKYDLQSLQEFDEKERIRKMVDESPEALSDQVLCMCCQEEYDAKYPICPHCGMKAC